MTIINDKTNEKRIFTNSADALEYADEQAKQYGTDYILVDNGYTAIELADYYSIIY